MKLTWSFVSTSLEYHKIWGPSYRCQLEPCLRKISFSFQVLEPESDTAWGAQFIKCHCSFSPYFLSFSEIVLNFHSPHETEERSWWSWTLCGPDQSPWAKFSMVSIRVSFLYASKINRLNGIRQLTCRRISGWGENIYLHLYVLKQLSEFILIFWKSQLSMCKSRAVILFGLWELSPTAHYVLLSTTGPMSLVSLINKILTAVMPLGPAAHSTPKDRGRSLSNGYTALMQLQIRELLEKEWDWGHREKNGRLLQNEEEGQRKWKQQRSTGKEELMGEEKNRGEITEKWARKDTLRTLKRSRTKIRFGGRAGWRGVEGGPRREGRKKIPAGLITEPWWGFTHFKQEIWAPPQWDWASAASKIVSTAEIAVPMNACDHHIQVLCDTGSTRLNPSKRWE